MKEIFLLLADYNSLTNREMIGILEKLPAEKLTQDAGSFYKSILGLVNHIMLSDLTWLERFARPWPELESVKKRLPAIKFQKLTDLVWNSLEACKAARLELDETIRRAFRTIEDGHYEEVLSYKNFRGEEQNKIAWRAFLHMFNHQTHHRGQVALLLDQFKVENDYSNLIWMF